MGTDVRIGIDARMWGPNQTGIGRYVASLCTRFFELAPAVKFILYVQRGRTKEIFGNYPNVSIVPVPERWYSLAEQITFPFRVARTHPDVLFVPHFNVPLLWRGKFVATIHDVTPLYFPGPLQNTSRVRAAAFKTVFASAVRRSSRLIAVSKYTRDEVVAHFGADASRIDVVYEGIGGFRAKEALSEERIREHRARYGLAEPYIFFTGVWRPHKNIVGLLEAFASFRGRSSGSWQLVLGGEEDARYPEIRAAWARLGLEKHIVRPGFIPEKELPVWYAGAHAVVVPSFVEGFGLVGLEAIAYGIPVAASNGGATPEILGDAAIYFDPHDVSAMASAMADVTENGSVRQRLVAAAQHVVSRYSWDDAAEKTLAILMSVAGAWRKK